MSSQQWLYPIFRFHGYRVKQVQTDEHRLLLHVEPQPHKVCCPQCGSREVIRRGEQVWSFRNLPVGSDCTWLIATLPRVECRSCGIVTEAAKSCLRSVSPTQLAVPTRTLLATESLAVEPMFDETAPVLEFFSGIAVFPRGVVGSLHRGRECDFAVDLQRATLFSRKVAVPSIGRSGGLNVDCLMSPGRFPKWNPAGLVSDQKHQELSHASVESIPFTRPTEASEEICPSR